MTAPFRQCQATATTDERCRRLAQPDSKYCHSHKYYRPKHTPDIPGLKHIPGIGLKFTDSAIKLICQDCGAILDKKTDSVVSYPEPEDYSETADPNDTNINIKIATLCEPCGRFRCQIESAIKEEVNKKRLPNGTPIVDVVSTIASWGVDKVLTAKVIRKRLQCPS
jgi:hypothetical protein